ncbi:MAG: RluA family pseudouridine synthase [Victivallaceae bacterium]|nr:RluA family pseudouridine synthase [Victivallaceae bacterium]
MASKTIRLTINQASNGLRFDRCLSSLIPQCSRAFLQAHIKHGKARVNGEICTNQRFRVCAGMELEIDIEEPESTAPIAEQIDLAVLYEDDNMLVINKPPDMVVHPADGSPSGTIVNALLARYPFMADTMYTSGGRPGIVHRLDKDTTGVLIAAKTPEAQFRLSKFFADRKVAKTYLALVLGIPRESTKQLVSMIGRHPVNRQKMAIVPRDGKEAITIYNVLHSGFYEEVLISLLRVNILTGRTHQIRVHLASIGHAIIGDNVYGSRRLLNVGRQMLHAWQLKIPHPATGELMSFEAPLPDDFQSIVDEMKQHPAGS